METVLQVYTTFGPAGSSESLAVCMCSATTASSIACPYQHLPELNLITVLLKIAERLQLITADCAPRICILN